MGVNLSFAVFCTFVLLEIHLGLKRIRNKKQHIVRLSRQGLKVCTTHTSGFIRMIVRYESILPMNRHVLLCIVMNTNDALYLFSRDATNIFHFYLTGFSKSEANAADLKK